MKNSLHLATWPLLLATVSVCGRLPQTPNRLSAPTYYLAIVVKGCSQQEVAIRGATNLPTGSIIRLGVSEFEGNIGWKDYSEDAFVTVDNNGFLEGKTHPTKDHSFRSNLVAVANFATYHPRQPKKVLDVVGEKGQNLGDIENPQLAHLSGNYRILETIARVGPCGPN